MGFIFLLVVFCGCFSSTEAMQSDGIADELYLQMISILERNAEDRKAELYRERDISLMKIGLLDNKMEFREPEGSLEEKMLAQKAELDQKARLAQEAGLEVSSRYEAVKPCFYDLLKEILKTKSGELLISSILKELKRQSSQDEIALNRECVKKTVISAEDRWAYNSSTHTLKIPKQPPKLLFAVIKSDEKDEIVLEEEANSVLLFHELLHWYHELADIKNYFFSAIIILNGDMAEEEVFWKHSLFPSFMAVLQNQKCKTAIFQSYIERGIASLEEASTIHGNGSIDFSKPRSMLSENMFRLELGRRAKILYADIPASSNPKSRERMEWIATINNQISQVDSNFKKAEENLKKPLPIKNQEAVGKSRQESFNTAKDAFVKLHDFFRNIQMNCDINTTVIGNVNRQIEDNIK
jgi:hypothetical protein